MKYMVDSYTCLEYFMGTVAGEKARKIIDSSADDLRIRVAHGLILISQSLF
jgi:hypothetical protein